MGHRRENTGSDEVVRRLAFIHAPRSPVDAVAELLVLENGDWVVVGGDEDWVERIASVIAETPAKDGAMTAEELLWIADDAERWARYAHLTFRSPYLLASERDPATGDRLPTHDRRQHLRAGREAFENQGQSADDPLDGRRTDAP